MIVIDQDSEVFNWLRELNHDGISSVRLDLTTFEISSGLQTELILIHEKLFPRLSGEVKLKLETCAGVLVYSEQDNFTFDIPKNLLGIIRSHDSNEHSVSILLNNEERIKADNMLKSQLISMDFELSELMGHIEGQLLKIKGVHEKNYPRRLEELDGVKFYSKYIAGESSGGEFFDLFSTQNKVFLMISQTSSYLASSIILQSFVNFKKKGLLSHEAQKEFISEIEKQIAILSESQDKEINLQLLTVVYDRTSKELNLVKKGVFQFYRSTDEVSEFLDEEIIHMASGQRFMLCSPGFKEGWGECKSCVDINTLIKDAEVKSLDILDESFYQLKKSAKSEFLKKDAAAIILEVS